MNIMYFRIYIYGGYKPSNLLGISNYPQNKLMCVLRYSKTLSSTEFKFIIGDTLDKFCAHAIISIKY